MRGFPDNARRRAGYELGRVQSGSMPSDWKPLKTVGPGVNEIRIHTGVEHRVCYVARFTEAIYVLHAFEKRSQRTDKADISLAKERLAQLNRQRAQRSAK